MMTLSHKVKSGVRLFYTDTPRFVMNSYWCVLIVGRS
jgi:hypothetical protein